MAQQAYQNVDLARDFLKYVIPICVAARGGLNQDIEIARTLINSEVNVPEFYRKHGEVPNLSSGFNLNTRNILASLLEKGYTTLKSKVGMRELSDKESRTIEKIIHSVSTGSY